VATNSKIEWTEMTWNPVTGCSKVSDGCKHCYAERMAKRLTAMGNPRYPDGFKVTLHDDLVDLPRRIRSPRVIFVNSMSDLFHEKVPTEFIARVFDTMQACPHHTFQVLTKRSARLRELAPRFQWPYHIWIGVSVEDRRTLSRIDDLRAVPAQVRFLSCEPLLGPLDQLPLDGISWAIVGGESGPGARPMQKAWVESIRQQCRRNRVRFFFKQWGGARKDLNGRELDGRTYDEMPPLTSGAVGSRTPSPVVPRNHERGGGAAGSTCYNRAAKR
jgi:protein gp37